MGKLHLVSIVLALHLLACGESPDGMPDAPREPDASTQLACPDDNARFMISAIAMSAYGELSWSVQQAGPLDQGFMLTPVGAAPYAGTITSVAACSQPSTGSAFCRSADQGGGEPTLEFWETRDACLRLGCEAANVALVDTYLTMKPRTGWDDRHAFTYPTATPFPAGTVTSDPNPRATWRIATPNATDVTASAQIMRALAFTPIGGGGPYDLSFTGSLQGTKQAGDQQTRTVRLSLPALSAGGAYEISLDGGGNGEPVGAVTQNGRTLATMNGTPPFMWSGCP